MAHYAKVENNIVTDVISASQEFINSLPDVLSWIQTSYNTRGNVHYGPDQKPDGGEALRANFAGIGDTYDSVNDVFYPKQPFSSWTISAATNWIWTPPVAKPEDGHVYDWDEATKSWVFVY